MADRDEQSAEHGAATRAAPGRAYAVVADVTRWPLIFGPSVHAQVLEAGEREQRIRLWATAGGEVRSWVSRRRLDPERHRVDFSQENPAPPFASVGGSWHFEPADDGCHIVLGHRWSTTEPGAGTRQWITEALDRNSNEEVAAVRYWAEAPDIDELVFSFTDEVTIAAPTRDVYDFLHRADLWPDRIPHVRRLTLTTAEAGEMFAGAETQTLDMETLAPDGTAHTTRSIRLCFDGELIVFKQTTVPRPLLAHNGTWTLSPAAGGTLVTVRHDVALDPEAVAEVFGPGATLAQARATVQSLLRTNSMLTLDEARRHTAQVEA
ncbi:aromatase/cyclase [Actinoplanes sp. NPDC051475]|uniref:aromatase/cyclase n=1 Tax=Actinoplanes sp. NPDC051475 TaxID=3157225 RepID=UPI00344C19C1